MSCPWVFALVEHEEELLAYWVVDAKPKSGHVLQRITNLQANPTAELLADAYEEDWSRLWWVRASVRGREGVDPHERKRAKEALVAKYAQYRDARLHERTFALEVTAIHSWSAES